MKKFALYGSLPARNAFIASLEAAGFTRELDLNEVDVVFTYLTDPCAAEDIYFDGGGLIGGAPKGAWIVDLSPQVPTVAHEIYTMGVVYGYHVIEAPLFVRDPLAKNVWSNPDSLICLMAAKSADEAREILPMISAIASTVDYIGEAGSAQLARAVLSANRASQFMSAAETINLCERYNTSIESVARFSCSEGFITEEMLDYYQAIAERRYEGDYSIHVMIGELTAATLAADDMGLFMPAADAALQTLNALSILGGGEKSVTAIKLALASEEESKREGLDWNAMAAFADQMKSLMGDFDDHDDCGCGCGHDHGHGHH